MKKEVRLYNVFFPIWMLLLFYPLCWIAVLPVNFVIDLLVIVLTLRALHVEDIKLKAKNSIWKVWIVGFIADIIGGLMMFSTQFITDLYNQFGAENASEWLYQNIVNDVMYRPFDNFFRSFG